MRGLFLTALLFCSVGFSQVRDVPYSFNAAKLSSVKKPLDFFRTFAEYFYLLEKENQRQQAFVRAGWPASGWCMGDAHLENFGTQLLRTGKPIFAINDWDDAGPCPVILDFFRLAVSATLMKPKLNLQPLFEAYLRGQKRQPYPVPSAVLALLKKSQRQGFDPSNKTVKDGRFVRGGETFELRADEKAAIRRVVQGWSGYKWVDGIRTVKKSGGSFGLTRYQLLLEDRQDSERQIHLELKEQAKPATLVVLRGGQIPSTAQKNSHSLQVLQGSQASEFYDVLTVLKKTMLLRPRFAGNDSWESKDSGVQEFTAMVAYEAYLLGRQRADVELGALSLADFQVDVQQMSSFVLKKYAQVVRP